MEYPIYITTEDQKLLFRQFCTKNDYLKLLLEQVYNKWLEDWKLTK